jgi:hypothetical protein
MANMRNRKLIRNLLVSTCIGLTVVSAVTGSLIGINKSKQKSRTNNATVKTIAQEAKAMRNNRGLILGKYKTTEEAANFQMFDSLLDFFNSRVSSVNAKGDQIQTYMSYDAIDNFTNSVVQHPLLNKEFLKLDDIVSTLQKNYSQEIYTNYFLPLLESADIEVIDGISYIDVNTYQDITDTEKTFESNTQCEVNLTGFNNDVLSMKQNYADTIPAVQSTYNTSNLLSNTTFDNKSTAVYNSSTAKNYSVNDDATLSTVTSLQSDTANLITGRSFIATSAAQNESEMLKSGFNIGCYVTLGVTLAFTVVSFIVAHKLNIKIKSIQDVTAARTASVPELASIRSADELSTVQKGLVHDFAMSSQKLGLTDQEAVVGDLIPSHELKRGEMRAFSQRLSVKQPPRVGIFTFKYLEDGVADMRNATLDFDSVTYTIYGHQPVTESFGEMVTNLSDSLLGHQFDWSKAEEWENF